MTLIEIAKQELEELTRLLFAGDYEAYRKKCDELGIIRRSSGEAPESDEERRRYEIEEQVDGGEEDAWNDDGEEDADDENEEGQGEEEVNGASHREDGEGRG